MRKTILLIMMLLICPTIAWCQESQEDQLLAEYKQVMSEEGRAAWAKGDLENVYNLALPFAEKGLSDAQFDVSYFLGMGYGHGKPNPSIEEREQKALVWLKKAATGGEPRAIQTFVLSFRHGWYALPKNTEISKCWEQAKSDKTIIPKCSAMMEKSIKAETTKQVDPNNSENP